jgi:chromosomal replication initiation ATPase DnaA
MTPTEVIDHFAKIAELEPTEITSKSKHHEICLLRQVIWRFLNEKNKMTVSEIGRFFDRDHSTIISGINRANNLVETRDPIIQKYL